MHPKVLLLLKRPFNMKCKYENLFLVGVHIIMKYKNYPDVRNDRGLYFLFDFFFFGELVEARLFPRTFESRRTVRAFPKLASRHGRRAAPADLRGGVRATRNPIGSPSGDLLAAALRQPISARERSPPTETDPLVLRLSPPRQQRHAIGMEYPDPRPVRTTVRA